MARDPPAETWDYTHFGAAEPSNAPAPALEDRFNLIIRNMGALNGSKFDTWTMNGDAWPNMTCNGQARQAIPANLSQRQRRSASDAPSSGTALK